MFAPKNTSFFPPSDRSRSRCGIPDSNPELWIRSGTRVLRSSYPLRPSRNFKTATRYFTLTSGIFCRTKRSVTSWGRSSTSRTRRDWGSTSWTQLEETDQTADQGPMPQNFFSWTDRGVDCDLILMNEFACTIMHHKTNLFLIPICGGSNRRILIYLAWGCTSVRLTSCLT